MALPPETNPAFLREVDEEVRRDQMIRLWKRWGIWIVVLIVAGLAAFGGWLIYQNLEEGRAGRQGEQYDAALADLQSQNFKQATPALKALAEDGDTGYRALAMFSQANLLLQKPDLKAAAAKFGEIASNAKFPQPFRDLALIRQTSAEYDSLKPEVVIQRLGPLATADSAWLGSAGEMVAAAYLKQGNKPAAAKLYALIAKTPGVPQPIALRAVEMAGVLGVDTIDQTEEKKAE